MKLKKKKFTEIILLSILLWGSVSQIPDVFAIGGDEIQFTMLTQVSTSGRTDYIEFVDTYCFVFDFEKGFLSYNVEDPEEPILLDTIAISNMVDPIVMGGHDFVIHGEIAIVDYMHSGIKLIDISDPTELTLLNGYFDGSSGYFRIDYMGDKIYCAKAEKGLEILQMAPDHSINSIGNYSNGNIMSHVICLQDDMIYIGDYGRSSTLLLNVSNPQNITEIKIFDWMAGNIVIRENLMYATIIRPDDCGLRIYNNSNPLDPIFLGEIVGFEAFSPKIFGDYAFLAGTRGMQIIDISNPMQPIELAQYYEDEMPYINLAVKDNIVALADFEDNWYLLEIENLDLPGMDNNDSDNNDTNGIASFHLNLFLVNVILTIGISVIIKRKSQSIYYQKRDLEK